MCVCGGGVLCLFVCVCVWERERGRERLRQRVVLLLGATGGQWKYYMWQAESFPFKCVHESPVNNQQGVKERSCIIGLETQTWRSALYAPPPPPCVSPWAPLRLAFPWPPWTFVILVGGRAAGWKYSDGDRHMQGCLSVVVVCATVGRGSYSKWCAGEKGPVLQKLLNWALTLAPVKRNDSLLLLVLRGPAQLYVNALRQL